MREIINNIIKVVNDHKNNITRLERGIADIEENIYRERENIAKIEKDMFDMLGLKLCEVVKFTQHEYFHHNNAYSVYFEQEVELRSLSIYEGALRVGVSRIGRKSVRFFDKGSSYSLFKTDGTAIVINQLDHQVVPYKVSEDAKGRYLEMQKI
jgi:hypothetical protein